MNDKQSLMLVTIFAVVAIVGISFFALGNFQTSATGQASKGPTRTSSAFTLAAPRFMDVDITVGPVSGEAGESSRFEITARDAFFSPTDSESFMLDNGDSMTLTTGTVTLKEGMIQAYAGGIVSSSYMLSDLCLTGDYVITTAVQNDDEAVEFTVNGEEFTLTEGNAHYLEDGNKIILREIVRQEFAGGMHAAPNYELLC